MNDAAASARWPASPVELLFNALMLGFILLLRRRRMLPGQHFPSLLDGVRNVPVPALDISRDSSDSRDVYGIPNSRARGCRFGINRLLWSTTDSEDANDSPDRAATDSPNMTASHPLDAVTGAAQELHSFDGFARAIVTFCTMLVLAAVFLNFQLARGARTVRTRRNSIVETGSMLLFFAGFYSLIRFRIGAYHFPDIYYPTATMGLALVAVGCAINVIGRFALGRNWGNQVIIYDDHTLVKAGIYRFVRHPSYASLIWMFLGAAILFQNWMALVATIFLFIPGMYYRATQEEKAFQAPFPDYASYSAQDRHVLS